MEFSGWALILLQLWGLQEAVSLMVQQQPPLVNVTEGDNVSLSCVVTPSQAWERLRVQWTLNNSDLCHMLISNGSLRSVSCESRRQLFWVPPGNLTLGLDRVSLNESGDYVCKATLEIPTLQEAQGNGTKVIVEEGDLQLKETFVQAPAGAFGGWGCGGSLGGARCCVVGPQQLSPGGFRKFFVQQCPPPAPGDATPSQGPA
ncbi:transmembrane and immunoglobulin domain-containing protein 2 isoform X3 [Meriones unguiculatus]|uniref:transmembrane and immunoglobulin domain-containing protein 2 isoform X3 n=1 Tax=Meriones unguiculatus TaxID=10047 RepID=UPI00293E2473|nr:transmembrane and immunoglobulin domain-containing protein 2 isoform X3 [Meriones unguiculatus]